MSLLHSGPGIFLLETVPTRSSETPPSIADGHLQCFSLTHFLNLNASLPPPEASEPGTALSPVPRLRSGCGLFPEEAEPLLQSLCCRLEVRGKIPATLTQNPISPRAHHPTALQRSSLWGKRAQPRSCGIGATPAPASGGHLIVPNDVSWLSFLSQSPPQLSTIFYAFSESPHLSPPHTHTNAVPSLSLQMAALPT